MMVGLDKQYLANHKIDANDIAGMVLLSAHTITHFTIRAEKGVKIRNRLKLFLFNKDWVKSFS